LVAFAIVGSLFGVQLGPEELRSHYREAAEWIDRDSPKPHPTVAQGEIGIVGYYSRADIVDPLGLLDARALPSLRRADPSWWVSQRPDYWVTPETSLEAVTSAMPQLRNEYTRAATFGALVVYRRTSL
jgi:hypothetical protein